MYMKYNVIWLLCLVGCLAGCQTGKRHAEAAYVQVPQMMEISTDTVLFDSLLASDPFIVADKQKQIYLLVSSGGEMWKSADLRKWTGPSAFLKVDTASWIGPDPWIWAPEIHPYNGRYYCFVTFTNPEMVVDTVPNRYKVLRRAVQILESDVPEGPYLPVTRQDYFPEDWSTLDGTLWIEDGKPYMVFEHGWMQIVDGQIDCIPLSPDLTTAAGEPHTLFQASDASWSKDMREIGELTFGMMLDGYVADGPFLFRTGTGRLGMLWSSWGVTRNALGVAYSETGKLAGPWRQQPVPLVGYNCGHGMLFTTFEGKTLLVLHHQGLDTVNPGPRRPKLFEVDLSGDELKITGEYHP